MMALCSWVRRVDEMLISPGATPGERLLGYSAGLFGAAFAAALATRADTALWVIAVVAIVGFDVFGGVVVNATPSGSRRFHGAKTSRWSGFGFVAMHVHPLALVLLLPEEMPWATAIVVYAGVVLATVLISVAPKFLRQPIAFAAAAILIALTTVMPPPATLIAWVLPLLTVKLLLSHLLPHPAIEPSHHRSS